MCFRSFVGWRPQSFMFRLLESRVLLSFPKNMTVVSPHLRYRVSPSFFPNLYQNSISLNPFWIISSHNVSSHFCLPPLPTHLSLKITGVSSFWFKDRFYFSLLFFLSKSEIWKHAAFVWWSIVHSPANTGPKHFDTWADFFHVCQKCKYKENNNPATKIINLNVKTAGQVEEAEGSCPMRGEAEVKSCCLDIRVQRESRDLRCRSARHHVS